MDRAATTPSDNRKRNLAQSFPKTNTPKKERTTPSGQTEVGTKSEQQTTPLGNRFSKSVPLNLSANDWDLEMEDPLEEVSVNKSEKKGNTGRESATEATKRLGTTPLASSRTPGTPDFAIMEEIEGLSNTLDNLLKSLEDFDEDLGEDKVDKKRPKGANRELKDLCTTLDYMLDSSEEEELDRDLEKELSSGNSRFEKSDSSSFAKISGQVLVENEKCPTTKTDPELSAAMPSDLNIKHIEEQKNVPLHSEETETVDSSPRKSSSTTTRPDEVKQSPRRRKLPSEPDKNTRVSRAKGGGKKQPLLSNSPLIDATSVTNSDNIAPKQSLPEPKRRGPGKSKAAVTQSAVITNGALRTKRSSSLDKVKNTRSIGSHSDSESNAGKSVLTSDPKNSKERRLPYKSKSAVDVSCEANANPKSTSKITDKQDPKSKNAGTSETQTKNPRNVVSKSQSLDSGFKKPEPPKLPKHAGKSRSRVSGLSMENGRKSLSTNDVKVVDGSKDRPPSGFQRSNSARAKRREEIASKLASLERSYETLEKSPPKTTKRASLSSTESTLSGTSRASSSNEQSRSSLRQNSLVRRTSSERSQSSLTSSEDIATQDKEMSKTRNSTYVGPRTRSRAVAKRTDSDASLEPKMIDGHSSKGGKEAIVQNPTKSGREKSGSRAANDNRERNRLIRSNAVDRSHARRTDSSGSETGNITTRRRKLPQIVSKTQDAIAKPKPNSKETSSMALMNDSFDDITVTERSDLECVVDGATSFDLESQSKQERTEELAQERTEDVTIAHSDSEKQELCSLSVIIDGENIIEAPDKDANENVNEDGNSGQQAAALKKELKLQNTGSWMVLDYKGLESSPFHAVENDLPEQPVGERNSTVEGVTIKTSEGVGGVTIETCEGAESTSDDEFTLKIEVGGSDERKEELDPKENEREAFSTGEESGLGNLVSNGGLMDETDSDARDITNGDDQIVPNGESTTPHENGTAQREDRNKLNNEIMRNKAVKRKPKNAARGRQKIDKMKSQSVGNLSHMERNERGFEEHQYRNTHASTLDISPRKRRNFPFLWKKKDSGSCSDLQAATTPEIHAQSPSPTNTTPSHLRSPDSSMSSLNEISLEKKKKIAPFKLFGKKRRSKDPHSPKPQT